MLASKDDGVGEIANRLRSVKDRLSARRWSEEFRSGGLFRGGDPIGFVGTELDALEHVGSLSELIGLRREVLAELRSIEPCFELAVLTMARDEALNLPEWVAHTLEMGAQHIFVYTNDNRDGTAELLDWFAKNEPVSVISTTAAPSVNIQRKNYQHALHMLPELYLFKWILLIDVDEFVILTNHNDVPSFLENAPGDAGSILFPWKWRLWQPRLKKENGLLCERFDHATEHKLFKSALRLHGTASLHSVHHPTLNEGWMHYDSEFRHVPTGDLWAAQPKSYRGGWIDHYWGRSFEEFLIKKYRGDMLEIPTKQFQREFSDYFSWSKNLTQANYCPVDGQTVANTKSRLARYEESASFRALRADLEIRYAEMSAALSKSDNLESLFNKLDLEWRQSLSEGQ